MDVEKEGLVSNSDSDIFALYSVSNQPEEVKEDVIETFSKNFNDELAIHEPTIVGGEIDHGLKRASNSPPGSEKCSAENNSSVESSKNEPVTDCCDIMECDRTEAEEESKELVVETDENSVQNNSEVCHVSKGSLPFWDYCFANIPQISQSKGIFGIEDYLRGCKWSPDGSCLLTNCADFKLRIFDLPQDLYATREWTSGSPSLDLNLSLEMAEGGLIYDFDWYPFMSSWNPLTCCFISSSAGSPVHLWDAFTGKIRATYRAYDYADEIHSALSLAFSPSGENIYCGFRNMVKVFDIATPGRECTVYDIKKIGGQKGIVSCIAENPAMPEIFAVGTFSKTLGLYTHNKELVFQLNGQKSGLTQVMFSEDGRWVYSGARMDPEIICWDLRSPGRVLFTVQRQVHTNQRVYFDLTPYNKYLLTGETNGKVKIWNMKEALFESDEEMLLKENFEFTAHKDCVNGISVNKQYPVLATSSGQKHYPELDSDEENSNLFVNNIASVAENCIKLWWIGSFRTESE